MRFTTNVIPVSYILQLPYKFTFFALFNIHFYYPWLINRKSQIANRKCPTHPRFSDINPPLRCSSGVALMKCFTICLSITAALLSLSCGGSGTSVNQADPPKQALTSHPPTPQSSLL